MESFKIESITQDERRESTHSIEKSSNKESIFEVLVMNDIISAFTDDLLDVGFTEEEVTEFEKEIEVLDEDSIKGVLSLPKELRSKNFPKYFNFVESQKKTIHEIVEDLAKTAKASGYTLGYHASNNDILPEGEQWMIDGTEFDDRDERTMAYYSLDYKNIFRAHRFKWLYIIRAHVGDNTSHKRDTSNNWGRASTLPIVHKLNLIDIDEQVEEISHQKTSEHVDIEKGAA